MLPCSSIWAFLSLLLLGEFMVRSEPQPFYLLEKLVRNTADAVANVNGMGYDTAGIRFINTVSGTGNISVVTVFDECHNCLATHFVDIPSGPMSAAANQSYYPVDTRFGSWFMFIYNAASQSQHDHFDWLEGFDLDLHQITAALRKGGMDISNRTSLFTLHLSLDDQGLYTVVLSDEGAGPNSTVAAQPTTTPKPPFVKSVQVFTDRAGNAWNRLPLLYAFLIYCGIAAAYLLGRHCYHAAQQRRARKANEDEFEYNGSLMSTPGSDMRPPPSPSKPKQKSEERVRSLDTFRGICLSIMIFVNYGGGGYWFMDHSSWNGLTIADLVFPWFIWMMGVSMAISFASLHKKRLPKSVVFYKVCRRAAILFWLGLFINNGYDLPNWRIPGVLQRFGVSYFFVSIIMMFVPHSYNVPNHERNLGESRGSMGDSPSGPESRLRPLIIDILDHWLEWVVVVLLMGIWLLVTFTVDVPGCGRGYLGPGGIGDYGMFVGCTGGVAGYIDKHFFGLEHVYPSPTCDDVYRCGVYDPEGLLGCLTSIVITFFGVQTGRVVVYYKSHRQRLIRWALWGLLLGAIAIGLCGGSQNNGAIPINKNMWSLSFVLGQAGMGCFALAMCYVVVDIMKWWNGAPWVFLGMNSIVIYTGSEILQGRFPFLYNVVSNSHAPYLVSDFIAVSCWAALAFYMFSLDFFVAI